MTAAATIHVMQVSLRFSATHAQVGHAVRDALSRDPDVVGFTEVATGQQRPTVLGICHEQGYLFHGGGGDTAVAVAARHPVRDYGSHFVHPGAPGPADEGGHGPRYIDWVRFGFHHEEVTFHEGHWIRRIPNTRLRRHQHADYTRAMCRLVADHADGPRLSLFGGDDNVDEAVDRGHVRTLPHYLFAAAGLRTIYDELHTYPSTHDDHTIDILGSYDRDRRVEAARVHVWPLAGGLDHRAVSAWYDIHDRRPHR